MVTPPCPFPGFKTNKPNIDESFRFFLPTERSVIQLLRAVIHKKIPILRRMQRADGTKFFVRLKFYDFRVFRTKKRGTNATKFTRLAAAIVAVMPRTMPFAFEKKMLQFIFKSSISINRTTFGYSSPLEALEKIDFSAVRRIAHNKITTFRTTEASFRDRLRLLLSLLLFLCFAFNAFGLLRLRNGQYTMVLISFKNGASIINYLQLFGFGTNETGAIRSPTIARLLSLVVPIQHVFSTFQLVIEGEFRVGWDVLYSEKSNANVTIDFPQFSFTVGMARVVHESRQVATGFSVNHSLAVQSHEMVRSPASCLALRRRRNSSLSISSPTYSMTKSPFLISTLDLSPQPLPPVLNVYSGGYCRIWKRWFWNISPPSHDLTHSFSVDLAKKQKQL